MKKLKIKVPELLAERGLDFNDLHFGSRITLNTAKRWADAEEAKLITRIETETLESIAEYLDAGINDLLELVDEPS